MTKKLSTCFPADAQLFSFSVPIKIKITGSAASTDRTLPLEGDAAQIPIDPVITQAERAGQFFAAEQFAILHVGALQNIDPVMAVVGFKHFGFEACFFSEQGIQHLGENRKEKRPKKGNLRHRMQTLSVRFYPDPDRFFDQAEGLFPREILDHLKIKSSAREDHLFGVEPLLFRQTFIGVTPFVAKGYGIVYQDIRLRLPDLLS